MRVKYLIIFASILFSCSKRESGYLSESWNIQGDSASLQHTFYFLKAIGGIEKWSSMKEVHYSSLVREPSLKKYYSEKWFSTEDTTLLIFKQTVEDYISYQVLNDSNGWVIENGTYSQMSDNTKGFMNYWIQMDFFKCITRLAKGGDIFVRFTRDGTLYVLNKEKDHVLFGFKFESGSWFPIQFLRPKFNSQNISLLINRWRKVNELMVPEMLLSGDSTFTEVYLEVDFCYDPPCFEMEYTPEFISEL